MINMNEQAITELNKFLQDTKDIIISQDNALTLLEHNIHHSSLFSYLVRGDNYAPICTTFNMEGKKIPAYTAQELMQIIPTRLFWDDKEYMLTIRYKHGYTITYQDLYPHKDEDEDLFTILGNDNLADILATTYIYLIENDIILLGESFLTEEQSDKLEKAMKVINKESKW